jgi:probable phosphoglycerate mutase
MEAIYCSELIRSHRTAEILAAGRVVPIHVIPALAEIYMGSWEGRLRREVANSDPTAYEARGCDIAHARPPGGESFADLAGRVLPLWRSIVEAHDGVIAIAGHAGVNRVILSDVLGLPLANLFRLAQAPGCVNVIEFGHNGPVVRLLDAVEISGVAPAAH